MYLVNESSKLESVNRVHEIGEKSHSLLDHPRTIFFKTETDNIHVIPDIVLLYTDQIYHNELLCIHENMDTAPFTRVCRLSICITQVDLVF